MTSLERCLAVLRGKTPDRTPVFPLMMFFAADRAGISYSEFSKNPSALADAQINLFENYGVDAITACSDSYRISADLGGQIVIPDGDDTPYLAKPLVTCRDDFDRLDKRPDPTKKGSRMYERVQSVEQMAKAKGDQALIMGWIEMPFAEACEWYGLQMGLVQAYIDPALLRDVMDAICQMEIDFALAQMEVGAHIIGCGDAAASLLSPALYEEFVLPYEKRVVDAIHQAGGMVKMHICGNTTQFLPQLATLHADLYNVDFMVDLRDARDAYAPAGLAFKGNINPVAELLDSTPEQVSALAKRCIELCKGTPYMLSCGCEIPKDVNDELYWAFANSVK